MKRSDIISKLKTLEKMTVQNGCTVAEAQTAKSLYLKLIKQYSITNQELGISPTPKEIIISYYESIRFQKPKFEFNIKNMSYFQAYVITHIIILPIVLAIICK